MGKFTDRTGEIRVMNCGLSAEIIEYRSSKDIDVKFEDGFVVCNVTYGCFLKGGVRNINVRYATCKEKIRVGESRVMTCGLEATIIFYRTVHDIDIVFEDGIIVEHKAYKSFKLGCIAHPDRRRGLYTDRRRGLYTVDKRLSTNCDARVGETRLMNCGMQATVISYRRCDDIDVKFEDGFIRRHVLYREFKNGSLQNYNLPMTWCKIGRVGEKRLMCCGVKATINYRRNDDIDIEFENGIIKEHVTYSNFQLGSIDTMYHRKSEPGKVKVFIPVYILNGVQYYLSSYRNECCIGTLEELRAKGVE